MIISNGGFYSKKIAFSGQKKVLDDYGNENHKFFYPYDSKKYKAEVEIYAVETTKDGKYKVVGDPLTTVELDKDGNSPEVVAEDYVGCNAKFAYRYKLSEVNEKGEVVNGKQPKYAFDPGIVTNIDEEKDENRDKNLKGQIANETNKFNIIFPNRAMVNKAGKMQLIMPDEYYPGVVRGEDGRLFVDKDARDIAKKSVRTHANKLGGSLLGIIHKLPELKEEGYSRIVGMPITKDTLSSHLYWTQNAYQVSPQLGGMEEFKTFQRELFKNGINWVSDAALVNEGLEGIHFKDVLKNGKDSPYYNWFKLPGLQKGGMKLGILPAKTENVRYKIVNSPFNFDNDLSKNKNYDPRKSTYIQFYDDKLASDEQKKSNKLIDTYDNNNTDNIYDITAHDDVIYPYNFEVKPEILAKNIKKYREQAGSKDVNLQSIDAIKQIMNFGTFSIVTKPEAGGFEMWDGNTDIAKLNFYTGRLDYKEIDDLPEDERGKAINEMKQGVLQVVDSAVNSGKYWTKLTSDVQMRAAVDVLKGTKPTVEAYLEKIEEEVNAGNLPPSTKEVMTPEVIANILADDYYLPRFFNTMGEKPDEFVLRNIMDFPLETLPLGDDLLGVMTSPYIQKRATSQKEVGISRYDIYKAGEKDLPEKFKEVHDYATRVYKNELTDFALDVLSKMDVEIFKDGRVTDLGKYVINEIMPEIMQYAVVKSMDRGVKIDFYPNGKIDFSKINPEELTLKAVSIQESHPEVEASNVVKRIKNGVAVIPPQDRIKLAKAFEKRFKNINDIHYKMADAIVDRTESGMGWRIDAAKDVSSIDAVRDGADSFEKAWENVIFVWKKFNESVKSVNRHVYTTAEITDVDDLINPSRVDNADNGRFGNDSSSITKSGDKNYRGYEDVIHPETKFLEETGITTTANYSYFYSLVPELYNRSAENGGDGDFAQVATIKNKLDQGWGGNPGLMYNTPLDGVIHSYTFVGNHDKPRMLHMLALEMPLFYSNFSDGGHRKDAAKVLGIPEDAIVRDEVSGKAVAMGKKLREAFTEAGVNEDDMKKINAAIAKLASGKFKGKDFDADAFGARPFEIAIANVLEQAKEDGFTLPNSDKLEAKVLGNVLRPAFDKYLSIYKTLVTLPGDVTDFAGDKIASTGYETKAKNYFQQNRNTIRWEWLDDPNRAYVKEFRDAMNKILALRNDDELSALNDGVPVTLNSDGKNDFASVLRYNDKDSMVITIYNASGAQRDNKMMNRGTVSVDKILLDRKNLKEGLAAGLSTNIEFKSTREGDNTIYKVVEENGNYYIKRFDGKTEKPIKIKPEDYNALVLYKPKVG